MTLLLLPSFLLAGGKLLVAEKLGKARPEQYILTEQNGNRSLLLVRDKKSHLIYLEEITAPKKSLSTKNIEAFVTNGAPGATSWNAYILNLKSGKIESSYSHLLKQDIFLQDGEHFLSKLLKMKTKRIPNKNRKKIGQEPLPGEVDMRAVWNPPKMVNGKAKRGHKFSAWSADFPADESQLAGSHIELYFDAEDESFPFPDWIEISTPHMNFKLRVLASGLDLESPMQAIVK